jgi:hypothetical protein
MTMASGSMTVTTTSSDIFGTYVSSSVAAAYTPAHELVVQNNGSGNLRLGDSGVNASQGFKLAPGEVFQQHIPQGCRVHVVAESGSVSGVSILVFLE